MKTPRHHVLVETRDGMRARFLINGAKGVIRRLAQDALEAGAAPEVIGIDWDHGPGVTGGSPNGSHWAFAPCISRGASGLFDKRHCHYRSPD